MSGCEEVGGPGGPVRMTRSRMPALSAGGSGGLVLVLNSGSSSIKFALFAPRGGERLMGGIGELPGHASGVDPGPMVSGRGGRGTASRWHSSGCHCPRAGSLGRSLAGGIGLLGAGHRVVHGGDRFAASVRVDDAVISAVRSFSHLAPLHTAANLAGIEAVRAVLPELPQVAVFDTAFHQTMAPHAFRYAVPEEWYRQHGVRRYGFHGTSHRFVSEQAASMLGRPLG